MRRGEFQLRDLYDMFNAEWESAPVSQNAACYECGKPAATLLPICGVLEPVCEFCAADLAETMLAEAV